jgi:hypothetical protein
MKMQREQKISLESQPESNSEISPKTIGLCVAGILMPGLGHAILGKWDRALVFLGSIASLFALGLYLHGRLFLPDFQTMTAVLKFAANAGTGLFYWIALISGFGEGNSTAYTYDYANVFLYVAGLLNMLVVIDVFDIAMGRKQ